MIRVLALTQLAFLTLGLVAFKIMFKSGGNTASSPFLQFIGRFGFWLYLVPLLWLAMATLGERRSKASPVAKLSEAAGVIIAVLCFLFLVVVTFVKAG